MDENVDQSPAGTEQRPRAIEDQPIFRESIPSRSHLAISALNKLFLAILVVSTAFVFTGSNAGRAAYADTQCGCNQYVANQLNNIPAIATHGVDRWDADLRAAGYVQPCDGQPRKGAVVVFQRGFPGFSEGHIAIIQDFHPDGDTWHVYIRGAAQTNCDPQYGDPQNHQWSEAGCNNVCLTWVAPYAKNRWDVDYYVYVGPPRSPDINHDGQVDILDFSILLNHWKRTGDDSADYNRDGCVDVLDFSYLLSNWGRTGLMTSPPPFVSIAGQSQASSTSSLAGPTIQVGPPSMVDDHVQVPVYTVASGFDPYMAFNAHLRWDPSLFALDGVGATGGLFEDPAGVCPDVIVDSDGGGASFACAFFDAQGTTETGLLATFSLAPQGSGCSRLHLATFGPPDNGNSLTGTLTVNAADITVQSNEYEDGSSNAEGEPCTPAPTPPPSPTPTPNPTPTPPPTPTPSPTPSPTPTTTPGATRTLQWAPGWHNQTWSGADGTTAPQDVFACADGSYAAAYRFVDGGLQRYFPGRPDISNMEPLNKYDAFLILVTQPVTCVMPVTAASGSSRTLQWGPGWHNEGWSGADGTAPQDAFACAAGNYAAAYRFTDAGLERYFPDRPDISNMGPLNKYDTFLILVTAPVNCSMPIAP